MPAAWREQVSAQPGCRMPGLRRHASRRHSRAFPKACEHRLGVVSASDLDLAASQTSACCWVGAQLSVGQARATSGR
jgi:hypothetical protein